MEKIIKNESKRKILERRKNIIKIINPLLKKLKKQFPDKNICLSCEPDICDACRELYLAIKHQIIK
jgi:hypothetical protein